MAMHEVASCDIPQEERIKALAFAPIHQIEAMTEWPLTLSVVPPDISLLQRSALSLSISTSSLSHLRRLKLLLQG